MVFLASFGPGMFEFLLMVDVLGTGMWDGLVIIDFLVCRLLLDIVISWKALGGMIVL